VTDELLGTVGIALDPMREQVSRTVATLSGGPGSPPFTPRAKKVLELSLREALDRSSPTIEPGDLLLGVLREGEGVAVQLLVGQGVDLDALRASALSRLEREPGTEPPHSTTTPGATVWPTRQAARFGGRIGPAPRADVCALCGRDTWDVDRFVTDGSVLLCEICIDAAAATIRDADRGLHRLTLPPRVYGTVPDETAPGAIVEAVTQVMGPEPQGGWGPFLEDADTISRAVRQARQGRGIDGVQAIVRRMRFVSDDEAWISLTVHLGPSLGGFPFEGPVRRIDGSWKVGRELIGTMLGAVGIPLPPQV